MVIWALESVSGCLVSHVSAWKTYRHKHGSEAPFLEFFSFSLGYLGGFLETACVLVVCLHSCTFGGVVLLKSLPSLHSKYHQHQCACLLYDVLPSPLLLGPQPSICSEGLQIKDY